MQAVIMAGGRGTRMSSVSNEIPKPMLPICGKPLLWYQLESLKASNIKEVYMVIGHLGGQIRDYFGDGKEYGVSIKYYEEKEPLGTAGALSFVQKELEDNFLLVFGDIFFDIDLDSFLNFHLRKRSKATLFVHPNSHPYDSDLIGCDSNNRIIKWDSKHNIRNYDYENLVNAGLYVLSKKITDYVSDGGKKDLEKDIIIPAISKGDDIFAYHSTEYAKDMGTPERYEEVESNYISGIPYVKNRKRKQKCIFLDRDGTINQHIGFLNRPDQMSLIDNAADAIREINNSEYLCIVISNQPVIARGECTVDELDNIHKRMEVLLGQRHAYIDDIFYCPHHPDKGFEGEVKESKVECQCRKPGIKMILDAADKYNIDLTSAYMVGDSTLDIETGKRAGLKTILVETGEAGSDGKYTVNPDMRAKDIFHAVQLILGERHAVQ